MTQQETQQPPAQPESSPSEAPAPAPAPEPAPEPEPERPPQPDARSEFMQLLNEYTLILPFQFTSRYEALVDKYHPKG